MLGETSGTLVVDEPKIVRSTVELHSSNLGGNLMDFPMPKLDPAFKKAPKSDCQDGSEHGRVNHVGHWHS